MKRNFTQVIFTSGLTILSLCASAQNFSWANQVIIPNSFTIAPVTVGADPSGNSYVFGSYGDLGSTMVAIGKSPNTISLPYNHAGQNSNGDFFIAKLDNTGKPVWANKCAVIGKLGGNFSTPGGIYVDKNGNSYISGTAMDSAKFENTIVPDKGGATNGNGFIAKYNTSGLLVFAKSLTTVGDANSLNVTVDAQGNSYVTGYYYSSPTFGTTTLANTLVGNYYVAKYNSTGTNVWASVVDSIYQYSFTYAADVAADKNMNVYQASSANAKFWVAQFSSTGTKNWETIVRGKGSSPSVDVRAVVVDSTGNSYVTGSFTGSYTFGTTTLTASNKAIFIVKLNATGSVVWAMKYDGGAGGGLELNPAGTQLYITGTYKGTVDFGSGGISAVSGNDVFVAGFNTTTGTALWAATAGGSADDAGINVAYVSSSSLIVGGIFGTSSNATATFGATTLTNTGSNLGAYFVSRIDIATIVNELNSTKDVMVLYPNPSADNTTIILGKTVEKQTTEINVYDITGNVVVTMHNNMGQTQFNIDTQSLANGVYFVKAQSGERTITRKLVVDHD